MGNLIRITTSEGSTYFTWGEGRMLTQVQQGTGGRRINYTYSPDGLRTKKAVTENGVTQMTEYAWGANGLAGYRTDTYTVIVLYDQEGSPVGFTVNHEPFTYVKNLQGDVIRILDTNGNTVVSYTYDPWGVPTVTGDADLAALNPCSYRGYDYDEETGYYYLQSRYYDPEIGRFINADDPFVLQLFSGTFEIQNLFSYCNNNPVYDCDAAGYLSLNSLMVKIKEIVQKVVGYLDSYVKSLFIYNSKSKTLLIRSVIVSSAIDAICIVLMRTAVYRVIKAGMETLLRNNSIRKEFIKQLFDFFVNNWVGRLVLKKLVKIGFSIAGITWTEGAKDAFISDLITNIASQKYKFLSGPISLISSLSSFGGIIAFFFGLMDGSPDDYVTIKLP